MAGSFGSGALPSASASPEAPLPSLAFALGAARVAGVRRSLELAVLLAATALGAPAPALIFTDAVANASATHHALLVNPAWASEAFGAFASGGAEEQGLALALMAHEMGHHFDPWLADPGHAPWAKELRADRVAGWVLGRVRQDPSRFVAMLGALSARASSTHPPAWMRAKALLAGFREAGGVATG